jgi:glycosyltransferase involved in cell wall biosynthesis
VNIILTVDYSPWSAYSGGAQQYVHRLATALAHRGNDVSVVYTRAILDRVVEPRDLPYRVAWARFHALQSVRRASFRPLNAFSVAGVVRRLLAGRRGAVVHAHGEEGARLPALRRRHPFGLVVTPHYGMYPDGMRAPGGPSVLQWGRIGLRESRYLALLPVVRGADLVCPPSTFAAGQLAAAYGVEPARLRVVPPGVDDHFLRAKRKPAPDGPIVFFGRFSHIKGTDVLLEAINLLKDTPPVVLVGRSEGDARIDERLRQLADEGRIVVREWLDGPALADLLSGARMVVLPSRFENAPLGLVEAMACGVPVVASAVGGVPETIEDGVTGVLVPPGDPAALAAAMRSLLSDPRAAGKLGAAAAESVRASRTWDRVAGRFEAIYAEVGGTV